MNIKRTTIFITLLMAYSFQLCYSQKKIKIMQPKVEFAISQATEMLNTGTAKIRGKAYYEGKSLISIKICDT